MTIQIINVSPPPSDHIIIIPKSEWAMFQKLCQRAGNLWPDAPPAAKEFIDRVTEGKVQQDYYAQVNQPRPN